MSNTPALSGMQCFDPQQDYTVAWKRLPHWAQAGTVCFITWRTADSLPKEVIVRLNQRRQEILRRELDLKGNLSRGTTELRSPVAPRPGTPPPDGEFWQVEQFDHLVRSPEDFDKYRRYIADNPGQAGLPEGSFRYFTKSL